MDQTAPLDDDECRTCWGRSLDEVSEGDTINGITVYRCPDCDAEAFADDE